MSGSSSSSAEMREYCKHQFKILGPVEALKSNKKATNESKTAMHARMLKYMQAHGIDNMQLAPSGDAGSGEPTLQVVISKYYNPKPLKEEVIREAHINWAELVKPGRSPADQVEHIFKEIQGIRKRSSPMVKVQPCGKLNRTRLPFIEADSPLFTMTLNYTDMQKRIKQMTTDTASMKRTTAMAKLEACALDELKRAKLKRRVYNIRGSQYVVKRSTSTTTKKPTVKQLKECIRSVVLEGDLDKRTFYAKLMALLNKANAPTTTESVVFEKVKIKPVKRTRPGDRETAEQQGVDRSRRASTSASDVHRSAPIRGTGAGLLVSRKSIMQQQGRSSSTGQAKRSRR